MPTLVPVATFAAYLLLGNSLSSTQAFVSLALFNLLRFPLFLLPQLLQQVTQAQVSLGRLQDFLQADTLDDAAPLPAAKPGESPWRWTPAAIHITSLPPPHKSRINTGKAGDCWVRAGMPRFATCVHGIWPQWCPFLIRWVIFLSPFTLLPPGESAVSLVGDFTWDSNGQPSLVDVDLEVPAGSLAIVVGATGSGKTTLLSAMLGQMQQVTDRVPRLGERAVSKPEPNP